jgi:hypothetical protein
MDEFKVLPGLLKASSLRVGALKPWKSRWFRIVHKIDGSHGFLEKLMPIAG